MTLAYGEIFAQRGEAYHRAMLQQPMARAAEFAGLFAHAPVRSGERLLDIPAGGGYLRQHLPAGVELVSLELTHGFGAGVPVHHPDEPWRHGTFDHIVCLAALHHIDNPHGFLEDMLVRLHPTGTLHLADVAADSGIARFLDEFVGRYNVTGHTGRYLEAAHPGAVLPGHVGRTELRDCPWVFRDEAALLDFCGGLFGLVDCPPQALRDALDQLVGLYHKDGAIWLAWQLLYVDLQPP